MSKTKTSLVEYLAIGALGIVGFAYCATLGTEMCRTLAQSQPPSCQNVCHPRRLVRVLSYNQKNYAVCGDTINEPELRVVP